MLNVLLVTITVILNVAEAYLSPLCCGDNFCCAILSSGFATCWGGLKQAIPSVAVKALTCGGKAVLAVDDAMRVIFYVGTSGYGVDSIDASDLVGVEVRDADLSFWGGAIIKSDGRILSWSQSPVYGFSSNSVSLQPYPGAENAQVLMAFDNVPNHTSSIAISCGGNRGGHFCCTIRADAVGLECFGDPRGAHTPTSSHLSSIDFTPRQISAGCDFVAVLSAGGRLAVYGDLSNGEIQDGTTNRKPTSISTLPQNRLDTSGEAYIQISTTNFGVYALKANGDLHSWGRLMTSCSVCSPNEIPIDMASYPNSVTWGMLAGGNTGGYAHICALSSTFLVQCWGADYAHQRENAPIDVVRAQFIYPPLYDADSSIRAATGGSAMSFILPPLTQSAVSLTTKQLSWPTVALTLIVGLFEC